MTRVPSSHGTGQLTPSYCSSGFAGSIAFGSHFPRSSPRPSTKEAHSSRAKYQENAMTSEDQEDYRALQARLKGLNDKILQAERLRANAEYESNRYRREAFGVLARMATLEKLANRRAAAKL